MGNSGDNDDKRNVSKIKNNTIFGAWKKKAKM